MLVLFVKLDTQEANVHIDAAAKAAPDPCLFIKLNMLYYA